MTQRTGAVDGAREYARKQRSAFETQLFDLIRIPSISTDPLRAADVASAAEWIASDMRAIGLDNVQVFPTAGHPIVYADWLHAGENARTILIYGHYDVQPAEMADGWTSEPFEPVVRDGIVYARGSSDDKGQMFIHLKAVESYLKTVGSLPVNVKFLLEGEEEVSSAHLVEFVRDHVDLLKADDCVISDTGMDNPDRPAITNALRGLVYMEIHVTGPSKDLHSGGYGGIVHNPALALVQILAKMHEPNNHIAVPGFYDDVVPLTPEDRAALEATSINEADLKAITGIPQPWGEEGYTLRERIGARPTLEINGLYSGFIGEGAKTVLPGKAMAKVSCRLVANQNPHQIYELVRDYVASITPATVTSEVRLLHTGEPSLVDMNAPIMKAATKAYERGWGTAPIFVREGGSIPITADFKRVLGVPVVLMGYGLTSDGAHGPDEHYNLSMFHRGIQTAICFLDEAARV